MAATRNSDQGRHETWHRLCRQDPRSSGDVRLAAPGRRGLIQPIQGEVLPWPMPCSHLLTKVRVPRTAPTTPRSGRGAGSRPPLLAATTWLLSEYLGDTRSLLVFYSRADEHTLHCSAAQLPVEAENFSFLQFVLYLMQQ